MTPADQAFLCALVKSHSGLVLGPEKQYLVESRLLPVARAAGFGDLAGLAAALRLRPDRRLVATIAHALATHETFFFRDRAVFDTLRSTVLPPLLAERSDAPVRIWSAAASTGQEAYSVAAVAAELDPDGSGRRIEITATDMVPSAVARIEAGLYTQMEVQRGLPIRSLLRHFRQSGLSWEVSDELRRLVTTRVMNLLDDFSGLGQFDIILCRNLLIYFDRDTKRAILERLAQSLAPGGLLCLGSSETVTGISKTLRPCESARPFFVRSDDPLAFMPAQPGRARMA